MSNPENDNSHRSIPDPPSPLPSLSYTRHGADDSNASVLAVTNLYSLAPDQMRVFIESHSSDIFKDLPEKLLTTWKQLSGIDVLQYKSAFVEKEVGVSFVRPVMRRLLCLRSSIGYYRLSAKYASFSLDKITSRFPIKSISTDELLFILFEVFHTKLSDDSVQEWLCMDSAVLLMERGINGKHVERLTGLELAEHLKIDFGEEQDAVVGGVDFIRTKMGLRISDNDTSIRINEPKGPDISSIMPLINLARLVVDKEFQLVAGSAISEQNQFRTDLINLYYPNTRTQHTHLKCMVLDMTFPANEIRAAHIFQKRWRYYAMDLDLEINDPRNGLLLHDLVEYSLDVGDLAIYFDVRSRNFKVRMLNPYLWDVELSDRAREVKRSFLSLPHGMTFSELDGKTVNLQGGPGPYKRCIAFLAARARYEAIKKKWIEPDEFLEATEEESWSSGVKKEALDFFIQQWSQDVGKEVN